MPTVADRPDPEPLRVIAAAEEARFHALAAVTEADSAVRTARVTELAAAQKAAYRRVTAAKGRLTRARRDGHAAAIAAAAQRLQELQTEADRIADAGIDESLRINSGGLDHLGALIGQMKQVSQAHDAVTATYADPQTGS